MFQRTAAFDLDESVALDLHDESPRRLAHFAGTLRDDGIEDVADVALGAVITHAQTVSAPHRLKLGSRGMSSFAGKRDTAPGRQEPSEVGARLSSAQSLQSKLFRDIDAVVVTRFWCPATATQNGVRSWLS